MTATEVNVLVWHKAKHNYIWLWDDARQEDFRRSLGMLAANDDLNFNWLDADRILKSDGEWRKRLARRREGRGTRWNRD